MTYCITIFYWSQYWLFTKKTKTFCIYENSIWPEMFESGHAPSVWIAWRPRYRLKSSAGKWAVSLSHSSLLSTLIRGSNSLVKQRGTSSQNLSTTCQYHRHFVGKISSFTMQSRIWGQLRAPFLISVGNSYSLFLSMLNDGFSQFYSNAVLWSQVASPMPSPAPFSSRQQ